MFRYGIKKRKKFCKEGSEGCKSNRMMKIEGVTKEGGGGFCGERSFQLVAVIYIYFCLLLGWFSQGNLEVEWYQEFAFYVQDNIQKILVLRFQVLYIG